MIKETTTSTLPHEKAWKDSTNEKESNAGIIEKTSSKIHEATSSASTAVSDLAERAKRRISETSEAAKQQYTEIKEQAAIKGSEAKQAVQSSFERRPLIYVAGALLAGVAIGMALPSSRKENRALASSGQKLRETASNAKRETMHAAEAAVDTFQDELSSDSSPKKNSATGKTA